MWQRRTGTGTGRTPRRDDADACLCALASQLVASGDTLVFGGKDEGFIVIPQFRGALSQQLRECDCASVGGWAEGSQPAAQSRVATAARCSRLLRMHAAPRACVTCPPPPPALCSPLLHVC